MPFGPTHGILNESFLQFSTFSSSFWTLRTEQEGEKALPELNFSSSFFLETAIILNSYLCLFPLVGAHAALSYTP